MAGFVPRPLLGRRRQTEPCPELLAQIWSAVELYRPALCFCDRSEHDVCPQRRWVDGDRHADAFPYVGWTVIVPFSNAADIRTCSCKDYPRGSEMRWCSSRIRCPRYRCILDGFRSRSNSESTCLRVVIRTVVSRTWDLRSRLAFVSA